MENISKFAIINPFQNRPIEILSKNKGEILIVSAIVNSVQLFTHSMMDRMSKIIFDKVAKNFALWMA